MLKNPFQTEAAVVEVVLEVVTVVETEMVVLEIETIDMVVINEWIDLMKEIDMAVEAEIDHDQDLLDIEAEIQDHHQEDKDQEAQIMTDTEDEADHHIEGR